MAAGAAVIGVGDPEDHGAVGAGRVGQDRLQCRRMSARGLGQL